MDTSIRVAHITFLECEIRGTWHNMQDKTRVQISSGDETYYQSWRENESQIWLVRNDGLRRNFVFKNGAIVIVRPGMIQFNQEDLLDEISVDEEEQQGNRPKSKLDF